MAKIEEPTEERRRHAARALAQWELGDPYWADRILRAYNEPEETFRYLRGEKAED